MTNGEARPAVESAKRATEHQNLSQSLGHTLLCGQVEPVALSIRKLGRDRIVAKIVPVNGQPVLAIVHRHQHGVSTTISVPLLALAYAERLGCRWVYLRRDTTGEMRRISLQDLRRHGYLKTSGGEPELFVKIAEMDSVPWRDWAFASKIAHLGEPAPEAEVPQPLLFGGDQ